MLNWDIKSLILVREELVKQAEKDHLAQDFMDETRRGSRHYNAPLAWVGQRMMDFGEKLVQISGDERSTYKPDIHLN